MDERDNVVTDGGLDVRAVFANGLAQREVAIEKVGWDYSA